MASFLLCPICNRPVPPRPGNRSHPFCSDRCRLIDLSKWLGEEYRVPGPRIGDGSEDEAAPSSEETDA